MGEEVHKQNKGMHLSLGTYCGSSGTRSSFYWRDVTCRGCRSFMPRRPTRAGGGLRYIREYYKVPAHQGHRVVFRGAGQFHGAEGYICGSSGPHLRVQFGSGPSVPVHPREVDYLAMASTPKDKQ